MISVQIVGGPRDGAIIDVEGVHRVLVAEMCIPYDWVCEENAVDFHMTELPVHLTRNGYRAYWSERRR